MIFTDEVEDTKELIYKLVDNKKLNKIKICVICFLFDPEGKLVLHLRGPAARDEVGKYEAIGGSVNRKDNTFRDAMKRELIEEAGVKAKFEIGNFIGAIDNEKEDLHTGETINWIILAYKGIYEGELINMEPTRCIRFEHREMTDYKEEELSSSCYEILKYLIDKK